MPWLKTASGPPNLFVSVIFGVDNSFLVWDASLLATVSSSLHLNMTGGKIENGLERSFVKHRLNYLLITDPECLHLTRISSCNFYHQSENY